MNTALRVLAVVLVVAGVIVLAMQGSFTFTETHDLGPISVREREGFHIPMWAGAGLLAVGVGIFIVTLIPATRHHEPHA